ncbi:MAG: hypothetical protein V3U98_06565 [Acidobacteriota bacterium]
MANLSRTFKAGETVTIPGRYVCLTCKYGGTDTQVQLEQGIIFPMCHVNSVKDATWQLIRRNGA